jgi:hypothetical protein
MFPCDGDVPLSRLLRARPWACALACALLAGAGAACALGAARLAGGGGDGGTGTGAAALALSAALVGQAVLLAGLAVWKELPRILQRRAPKPAPVRFLAGAALTALAGVVTGALVLVLENDRSVGERAAPAAALGVGCAGVALSCVSLLAVLVAWVVDREVFKPYDAQYDSWALFYLRCLCWSHRTRRLVCVAAPLLALTVVALVDLALADAGPGPGPAPAPGPTSCVPRRRAFLGVAAALLASYAALVTAPLLLLRDGVRSARICGCVGPRAFARGVLLFVTASSLAWGIAGAAALHLEGCADWRVTHLMHVLLIVVGAGLVALSLLCNTESMLVDYYAYHSMEDLPGLANGFRRLMLDASESNALSSTDSADETDQEDEGLHDEGIEAANATPDAAQPHPTQQQRRDVGTSDLPDIVLFPANSEPTSSVGR